MADRKNLETQLEEMEMLNSIFSQPGEFRKDRDSCSAVLAYVKGGYEFSPPPLVYALNLTVDDIKLEVSVTLPTSYPAEKPNVYLRETSSSSLARSLNIAELNNKFKDFMSSLEKGETCIYQLVDWLQENMMQYTIDTVSASQQVDKDTSLSRYWIYSHHIYSKKKRRDILDLSAQAELTGFILPGRPGIMCLEGSEQDCHNTWVEVSTTSKSKKQLFTPFRRVVLHIDLDFQIKHMNWQKIAVKTEEKDCLPPRKFSTFAEVCFEGCSDRHMDMGKFLIYLKEHNCDHVFKEYFGCDGQIIDNA